MPASYCGILGLRPTHGRVSLEGACPLAPSFDTGAARHARRAAAATRARAPVRGAAQLLPTSSNTKGSHGDRTVRCFAVRQPAADMLGAMGWRPCRAAHSAAQACLHGWRPVC